MTDIKIHSYTAAEQGLFVNSYLLETADGVVLIDANLLVSDARALAARLAALHKPLLAAFVTHAHPDHFNGLPYVAGDEWPDRYRVPDHPLAADGTVEVGGPRVEVHDLGPAESHADSYVLVHAGGRRAAFIGDLAFEGVHAYTADGHTAAWLDVLDRLTDNLSGVPLYPGHGSASGSMLLADQRRYLLMYRETVRRLAAGAPALTDAQHQELTDVMTRFLPGAPLTWLVALGADAVAAELAAQLTPA